MTSDQEPLNKRCKLICGQDSINEETLQNENDFPMEAQHLTEIEPMQIEVSFQNPIDGNTQPERPKSPEKKLSPAEIQRRKINAASEYFKKLRENAAANAGAGAPEKSDAKSVPSKQVPMTLGPDGRSVPAGSAPLGPPPASAPLGPPPPLIPTTFAVSQGNLLMGIDNCSHVACLRCRPWTSVSVTTSFKISIQKHK